MSNATRLQIERELVQVHRRRERRDHPRLQRAFAAARCGRRPRRRLHFEKFSLHERTVNEERLAEDVEEVVLGLPPEARVAAVVVEPPQEDTKIALKLLRDVVNAAQREHAQPRVEHHRLFHAPPTCQRGTSQFFCPSPKTGTVTVTSLPYTTASAITNTNKK